MREAGGRGAPAGTRGAPSRAVPCRAAAGVLHGVVLSTVFAALALLIPLCIAVLPLSAAFGVLGSPWSWTNPWSWVGLAMIAVPVTLVLAHPVAAACRRVLSRGMSIHIESGFREHAEPVRLSTGFWWNGMSYERSRDDARLDQRVRRMREPAFRREVRWAVLAAPTVGIACALPVAALVVGIVACTSESPMTVGCGVGLLVAGLITAPWAWRIVPPLARAWLAPRATSTSAEDWKTQRADLSAAHDAEIRRIERDLHDGAQARLVAVGLDLAAAEQLVRTDPDRAEAMLRSAREGTRASLNSLRDLVRGVYPPVLIERGLVPALRAAALDSPLTVTVSGDDEVRLPSPMAAALYFATTELLTNVAKHARVSRAAIAVTSDTTWVTVTVRDAGAGGASPRSGSGLEGVRRRLDVFDAVLDIHSPVGGPTMITVRMPCASS